MRRRAGGACGKHDKQNGGRRAWRHCVGRTRRLTVVRAGTMGTGLMTRTLYAIPGTGGRQAIRIARRAFTPPAADDPSKTAALLPGGGVITCYFQW